MSPDDRVPDDTGQGWRSPRAERVRGERAEARAGMSRRRILRAVGIGVAAIAATGGAAAGGVILRDRLTQSEVVAVAPAIEEKSILPTPSQKLETPAEKIEAAAAVVEQTGTSAVPADPVAAPAAVVEAPSRQEAPPVIVEPTDDGIINEPPFEVVAEPPPIGISGPSPEPAPTGLTPLFPDYTLPGGSRLLIPAIEVDATVLPFGVDEFGRMEAPDRPQDVGWFELGPLPGTAGNAILTGHVDWYDGTLGVFRDLGSLNRDDRIEFTDPRGVLATYRVLWQRSYAANNAPISEIIGQNLNLREMTLITCDGTFEPGSRDYSHRLIVRCEVA
jgi:hypothetical protein